MKLEKDIIWFDFETDDVDTEVARIIQIAATKIKVDGTKEVKEMLINPEKPISVESTAVHGITDDMVKDSPVFRQIAVSLRAWYEGCDLATFNGNQYDIPVLNAELVRAGLEPIDWDYNTFDVRILYQKLFPNTLSDLYKRLTGKDLIDAHNAQSDVNASIEIGDILLAKLKEEQPDIEINSVKDLDLFLQADKKRVDISGKLYEDVEGIVRWNFSKNKDEPVKKYDSFNDWFLKQNFAKESKDKLKQVINKL